MASRSFDYPFIMTQAPSAEDQFDEEASRRLESIYLTPDVVEQRAQVMALLQAQPGQRALDIGCGPGLTTQSLEIGRAHV